MKYDWITQSADKPWLFTINVDAAYPQVLAELGVTAPTQYDLEFVHTVVKLDAQMFARTVADPSPPADASVLLIMEGGMDGDETPDAYKGRWAVVRAPEGQDAGLRKADQPAWERRVAAAAKNWYSRTRGYLPA